MKLPKNTDTIIHGTGIKPVGARIGWVIRIRLKKSGELRTQWFPDHHIELLDNSPEKFYKRFSGIQKVTSNERIRAWRYEANAVALTVGI